MNAEKVIIELQKQYPQKIICVMPETNPTEMVCEIDPAENHPDYSIAVAVIDESKPHFHDKTTEEYEVIKGMLELFIENKKHVLHEGDVVTIPPRNTHYAKGRETWVKVTSTPGWTSEDHIILKDNKL
jgi:mannose-6-phosphate isomerase-like protein (cupin superfamily)